MREKPIVDQLVRLYRMYMELYICLLAIRNSTFTKVFCYLYLHATLNNKLVIHSELIVLSVSFRASKRYKCDSFHSNYYR